MRSYCLAGAASLPEVAPTPAHYALKGSFASERREGTVFSSSVFLHCLDEMPPSSGSPAEGGVLASGNGTGFIIVPYLTAEPKHSLEFWPGGRLLKVKFPGRRPDPEKESPWDVSPDFDDDDDTGKRQAICEFSRGSARRLRELTCKIRVAAMEKAHMVTLTYPGECPLADDFEVYKRHLHSFGKRLLRHLPESSALWKLEFQERGAPHFHLILFGLDDLEAFKPWLSRSWFEVVGSRDPRHLAAGTNVSPVKNVGAASFYLASYVSKGDQTLPGNFTGRYWGKINAAALPFAEMHSLDLTRGQAVIAQRIVRKVVERHVNASNMRSALRASLFAEDWTVNEVHFVHQGKRSLQHHAGGKTFMHPEHGLCDSLPTVHWSDRGEVPYGFKFPRKYRVRHGQSCSYYGDASVFSEQLKRAISMVTPGDSAAMPEAIRHDGASRSRRTRSTSQGKAPAGLSSGSKMPRPSENTGARSRVEPWRGHAEVITCGIVQPLLFSIAPDPQPYAHDGLEGSTSGWLQKAGRCCPL